ncbi:MAG: HEAT repeat domain-containing protein, partial [Deltaproteobacteria bacterium]|nr:HEAT repeat domain-containing protein [Deltaproteobacteria bacterium]
MGEQGLTECLDDVRRHLTSGDKRVQGAAARAAGQLGDRAAIATMEALLGSADCFVQKGAAEGLAALNAVESLERLRAVLPGTVPTAGMAIEAAI